MTESTAAARADEPSASSSKRSEQPAKRRRPWWQRVARVVVVIVALPTLGHFCVQGSASREPPASTPPPGEPVAAADDPTRRDLGPAYARKRGAITEVRLVGDPVTVGTAHTRLLYDEQVAIERYMHDEFTHYVPLAPARMLLVDMARLRFRSLDEALSLRYRQEIAAQAAAFEPDPFTSLMDTYQRMVFLHSLYDIMLSFERSPLVGCTSFVVDGHATVDGHTLVGRNFDFEGPQILDDKKAVFLMREEDRIPYASVSWPGFVGAASGMNIEGVAIVIHGARAGEANPNGEPVAETVR